MSLHRKLRVLGCVTVIVASLSAANDVHAEEHPTTRRPNATAVVGASAVAVGYVPMFAMGTASFVHAVANFKVLCGGGGLVSGGRCPENDAIVLVVPIVGPVLYAQPTTGDDLYRRDRGPSTTEQALLYSSAALQLGGLVTAIVGTSLRPSPTSRLSSAYVAPMTTPSATGLAVGSAF